MPPRPQLDQALGHAATDRRLDILRRVGACGSISQAAREAGVSYKAAWQALDMLSNLAGVPLVERVVGGAGGGGASVTAAGHELLRASQVMARSRAQVLAGLGRRGAGQPLGALALRTSMRNQLPCTVGEVAKAGPLAQVELQFPSGLHLVARITAESAQLLGLRAGQEVLALCKATAVRVERQPARGGPARPNSLSGRVVRASRGDSGDEIAVETAEGLRIVGFALPASGLRTGSRARASVDASALVIALAA
jgi:molybdate transport system regulatory protein